GRRAMETYLRVTFSSEGARPSEVAGRLQQSGFAPTQGNYDFVYDWNGSVTTAQLLDLYDEVTNLLRGYGVLVEIESV
ncbi:MAG: hypothetical protein L3J91_05295, partial [Thermoplasmata archaeon]|nr:hypothetical protein [Thermoplasmata archaeon]